MYEFEQAVPDAFTQHLQTKGAAPATWRPEDYAVAHGQILASRLASRLPETLHPLASESLDCGRVPSLLDLARTYLAAQYGVQARGWDVRDIMATGTAHLADIIVNQVNAQVLARQPDLLRKALRITRPVEVKDYRPDTLGTIELDAEAPAPATTLQPWQTLSFTSSGEVLQLAMAPLRVRFSEQLLLNDNVNALDESVRAAQIAASQNELAALFGLMNDNVNMSDGSPIFAGARGNLLAGQSKDLAAVNAALALLRAQQVNGKSCDADAALLAVPAGDEATARTIAMAGSGVTPWLEVVASDYLDAGAWVLFANPTVWPVFVRGTPRGAGGVSLRFNKGNPNEKEGVRDLIIEGFHTVAYAPVSRVGAVLIEVS